MKVLKGFALGVLGFLLFWSLSIFGIAYLVNSTILNPDFMVTELKKLDITSLARDMLTEMVPPGTQAQFFVSSLDSSLTELKPWIYEQAGNVIYTGYDYLLGKSQNLTVTINLDTAKNTVINNAKKAALQSPPPELQQIPPAERERFIDQMAQQYLAQIPSTFELSAAQLGPEATQYLQQAREYIGYFQMAYWGLIIFILLLIAGIVLIHRQVRGAARTLGTTFLFCGVLEYAGYYIAKTLEVPALMQTDMPLYLQTWLSQLLTDLLAPGQVYGIALLIIGVVLLIISFVYPAPTKQAEASS